MQKSNFFAAALRSLMTGAEYSSDIPVSRRDVDLLIRAGLGPIFYHVIQMSNLASEIDPDQKLKASDMTSRILTAEMFEHIERAIGSLQDRDIDPIMLKGISFASRYYEEPHLRVMADIDLLLPPGKIGEAERFFLDDGYVKKSPAPNMDYDQHIHSAPLFHSRRKLWFELHRCLMKNEFASSQEIPLNLATIEQETERLTLGRLSVRRFCPEFELMYLAAGWCFDLQQGFGRPGLQRSLVDCTLILKTCGHTLNWDKLLRWSDSTLSGACLYVLLSFLNRIGVYDDRENVCRELGKRQRFVNPTTLGIMHTYLEKHLVQFDDYGRVLSQGTICNTFAALLRKEAAWKNVLAIPASILFPKYESRRYSPQYQFDRIRNVLKRRQ